MRLFSQIALSIFLVFASPLLAEAEEPLFAIHAKLMPRIVLFDQNFERKLIDGKLVFGVVTCPIQSYPHQTLIDLLKSHHPEGVKGIPLTPLPVALESAKTSGLTSLYLMCGCGGEAASTLLREANKQGIITFACDEGGLGLGALIGVKIGRQITPRLHEAVLNEQEIRLSPSFLKLIEVYHAAP